MAELKAIALDRIESIEVIKGPAAARQYDDRAAAYGVIVVRTNRAGARK
jgi:outer membrane receptor for ferrienterochelin and colicin